MISPNPNIFNPIQPRKGSFVISIITEGGMKDESDSSSNEGKKGTHTRLLCYFFLLCSFYSYTSLPLIYSFYSSTILFVLLNLLYITLPFSLKFITPFLPQLTTHFRQTYLYCKRTKKPMYCIVFVLFHLFIIYSNFFVCCSEYQETVILTVRQVVIMTISYSLRMIPQFSSTTFITYNLKMI